VHYPGLGQIYCGRGGRGVGFFLLNFFLLLIFGSASSENPNSEGTGFSVFIGDHSMDLEYS